jgi:hypothetical protein
MDFDTVISREADGVKIEYGALFGGDCTVFIKAGRGGTYRGEGDKYLRFAAFLREKYGVSVVCASNPEDSRNSREADISVLSELARGEVYLWGTSDGAFKCIDIAERLNFRNAVLVNMPLMINFYKNKERLKKLPSERIAFAFGEHDASMKFTPFLFSLGCELVTISGAGHTLDITEEERELFGKLIFEVYYE